MRHRTTLESQESSREFSCSLIVVVGFGKKHDMQKPKTGKRPFFARFLESQQLEKLNGGGTLKYPSDRNEWEDNATCKYPSDTDESGGW